MGSLFLRASGRSDRGVGIKYGPDVTTKFCSQNRLRHVAKELQCPPNFWLCRCGRFLVRSHQVPEDGHARGWGMQCS